MAAIDSRQLRELTSALDRHEVQYLYIGKSAAIIHGFPDTTQDADVYVNDSRENNERLATALKEVGFAITPEQEESIRGGKDFIQLHNGPFDVDLVYAPDGIEKFDDAWRRGLSIEGHKVCSIADVIASKRAANRQKDRESLDRLEKFAEYLEERPPRGETLPTLNPTWREQIREELQQGRTTQGRKIGHQPPNPAAGPQPARGTGAEAEAQGRGKDTETPSRRE